MEKKLMLQIQYHRICVHAFQTQVRPIDKYIYKHFHGIMYKPPKLKIKIILIFFSIFLITNIVYRKWV